MWQHVKRRSRLFAKGTLAIVAMFTLVLLMAGSCGGNPPAAATLELSPASATVQVGDSAITFTATLTNATDTITWTLTGAGSIPAGATGTTVSYTPPTTGGASTATLTATAGSLSKAATITIQEVVAAPSLSVSPKTLEVIEGSAAVSFSAILSNSTDTISWSLTGAGSIPAASTGATVSYTPPATGGAGTATLTATAGSLSDSATITVRAKPTTTVTVTGKVLNFDGSGANGVNVQINDATAASTALTALTDATGSFSIPDVLVPYTLSVIPPAGTSAPQSWTGVTRTDPTVVVTPLAGPANCATPPAPGTLTVNWATPVAAGNQAQISYVAPGINNLELLSNVQTTVAAGTTTATLSVNYDPSICDTTVTGKVIYIEFDGSNNIVRTGSVDATVLTGNTTTVTVTQLTASTKTVSGSVSFPAGTTTTNVFLMGKVGDASFQFFFPSITATPAAPTYSFAAPEIPELQFYTVALTGGFGTTAQWRWSDAISTLPATANLSLPNLGATSAPAGAIATNTTPTFSYTAVAGANLYTAILKNDNASLTQWLGSTSTTAIKLPALPAPARLAVGSAATPNQFSWVTSAIQVRAGGDSDTMLDGRQVKKLYAGLFSIFNPDVISAGSLNNAPTTFTLP